MITANYDYFFKKPEIEPGKVAMGSLQDPIESKFQLDSRYPGWNKGIFHQLPFFAETRKLGNVTEKRVYSFLSEMKQENMFIVHNYQHGRKHGVLSKEHYVVNECDFILIHYDYGPLLIEVKGTKEDQLGLDSNNDSRSFGKHICDSIDASEQLEKRWKQLENYIEHFFKKPEVRDVWNQYFNVDDVWSNVKEIFSTYMNRSFICLFGDSGKNSNGEKNEEGTVTCQICQKTNVIKNARILRKKDLLNSEKFIKRWNSIPKSNTKHHKVVYEIMRNRIVLDQIVSEHTFRNISLRTSIKEVEKATGCVRHFLKNGGKILLGDEQLNALRGAKYACIQGPPGTGKTYVMIEKVCSLLESMDEHTYREGNHPILIICHQKPLREYIADEINHCLSNKNLRKTCERSSWVEIVTLDAFLMKHFAFKPTYFKNGYDEIKPFIDRLIEDFNICDDLDSPQYHHIFVDESQDMKGSWFRLLRDYLWLGRWNQDKETYFWILFDPSQNTTPIDPIPLSTEGVNFYYLTTIFRATQKQTEFMSHYIVTECSYCKEAKRKPKNKRKLCIKCRPKSTVNIQGHAPIFLSFEGSEFESASSQFMEAIKIAWKTWPNVLNNKCDQISDVAENCFRNTFIIVNDAKEAQQLKFDFNKMYQKFATACLADEWKKMGTTPFLRIDSYRRFKGLEATVVIVFNPPLSMPYFSDLRNHYTTMFSRATCLTVVVTSELGKATFESHMLKGYPFEYDRFINYRFGFYESDSAESDNQG